MYHTETAVSLLANIVDGEPNNPEVLRARSKRDVSS